MVINNIEVPPEIVRDALLEVTGEKFAVFTQEGLAAAMAAVRRQAADPETAMALAQAIATCSKSAYAARAGTRSGMEHGKVSLRSAPAGNDATNVLLDDAPSEAAPMLRFVGADVSGPSLTWPGLPNRHRDHSN